MTNKFSSNSLTPIVVTVIASPICDQSCYDKIKKEFFRDELNSHFSL